MNDIIKKAEQFVIDTFNTSLPEIYVYHNYTHTRYVVKKVKEIAKAEKITEEEKEMVVLAAWFHDLGYIDGKKGHEERSANMASRFLRENDYPVEKEEVVIGCIKATDFNFTPITLLNQMIRDADTAHFAEDNYSDYSKMLKTECEILDGCNMSKKEWNSENIKIFNTHNYFTKYANATWLASKNKNLLSLNKSATKKAKSKSDDNNRSERSVDTLFRVTLKNHITLSDIADTKANILLSVNAIIISVLISNLVPRLSDTENHYLMIPTITFVIFSAISIILSVMATRPNVTAGTFTQEDVDNKKVNLLFFGNFHKMKLVDYEAALKVVMDDKDYLYSSMTKDLYFLGQVLSRKYSLLRLTYTIFIVGIIVSIVSFGLSYYFQ
ncbi:MAG: HD domain-containing protein [Saprospiraceae bacterium]|jgi:hypothetical protein|nr:HD domain-containing protein [Saprospiraceae bacterium]